MADLVDEEITRALETEALFYEPPNDLGTRTLNKAGAPKRFPFARRIRVNAISSNLTRLRSNRLAAAGLSAAVLFSFYAAGYYAKKSSSETLSQIPPSESTKKSSDLRDGTDLKLDCDAGNCAGSITDSTDARTGKDDRESGSGDGGSGEASSANAARVTSIIRTGEVEVRIRKGEFQPAWARATGIAGKHGGLLSGSSAEQFKGRLSRGTLVVRIPAENLDAAVADFQALGKVSRLNTSSSDAGVQLVDYDARIRGAQARELQLLDLLKQAQTVSDSLQVATTLSDVRTEIETLQAQRVDLQNQVDLASLTVLLHEPQAAPKASKAPGRLATAWDKALDGATSTVGTIVIGAGFVLPVLALLLGGWGLLRLRNRSVLG